MRVECLAENASPRRGRSAFTALVVGLGLSLCMAQDSDSSRLNDVKLLAQRSALASLSGENPFILRESWWSGTLDPGKAKLIQVQLFQRNEYQFWLAVPEREAKLNLNLYDGKGELVETEEVTGEETRVLSMIVRPPASGVYYVRVSLQTNVTSPQDWAVIYAYK